MSKPLVGAVNPLAPETTIASNETIRKFVKDLAEVADTISDARSDMKEAIESNNEIENLDEKIKLLKEERKDLILNSSVIQGYKEILDDAKEDRRQLISDAKRDGVPRGEINLAIKALKSDIDITVSSKIYSNIADLVD